jgi:hypothetical protein
MENYNQTSEVVDENNKITGYCDVMAKELSNLYNKTIYFWPCPKMKVSHIIQKNNISLNFFNYFQIYRTFLFIFI